MRATKLFRTVFPIVFLSVFLLVMLGMASAQTEVSGTITGTLGGEERSWYTIRLETEDEVANTAEWMNMFGAFHQFSLQGHREVRFQVEGTLSLDFSFYADLPESCPCQPDEASILYFASSSIMADLYEAEDASVTITSLEFLDDETVRLTGEFSASLLYRSDAMSEPDPAEALELTGIFEVIANKFDF